MSRLARAKYSIVQYLSPLKGAKLYLTVVVLYCMSALVIYGIMPSKASSGIEKGANMGSLSCPYPNEAIFANYQKPGVRQRYLTLLAQEKALGVTVVRNMIWYWNEAATDPRYTHGVPTSFPEPYRTNVRLIADDTEAAGMGLIIAFGPQSANQPEAGYFDPGRMDDNWNFVRQVRDIAEAAYPATKYDIQNEGGYVNNPVGDDYIRYLWTQWVNAYGATDGTISFHSGRYAVIDSLVPHVPWYEVHVYDLHGAAFLVPDGAYPVSVGETYADKVWTILDPRIINVIPWPANVDTTCHSLPFAPDIQVAMPPPPTPPVSGPVTPSPGTGAVSEGDTPSEVLWPLRRAYKGLAMKWRF